MGRRNRDPAAPTNSENPDPKKLAKPKALFSISRRISALLPLSRPFASTKNAYRFKSCCELELKEKICPLLHWF